MKLELLEPLTDDQLRSVAVRANELLQQRDEARKIKAREDAIAILEAAGLSLEDLPKRKKKPAPAYKAGHQYVHPEQPEMHWNGTGVRPGWIKKLEAEGRRPVEAERKAA